ncbi:pseudouridine synthase [Paraburkholderia sp.]|uniref:pseudouridine synthase n=1 Tax=Paraburkholderia sp. TaxID=1926495 RepID=UPI002F42E99B
MRVKLTAKHPRSASSERAPVRSGSTTARKPTRPAGPRPATPAPAGAARRPAGKPAGGARPPRSEGSFSRERDAGGGEGRRAPSADRPPRREGAAGAPRRFEGGSSSERAPRRFEGERSERAPRHAEGERTERGPRRAEAERGERAPRRFEGERSERAPRRTEGERFERTPRGDGPAGARRGATGERTFSAPRRTEGERGERPARFARDEGTRRPATGGPRGAADDTRRSGAPRTGRPSDAGGRDARPPRREGDTSRERGTSERPRFGADRGGAREERRSFERPSRDDNARRAPSGERPASKPRGSFERGERSFAKPVKSGYGDRPERGPREDAGARAPAKRDFGDRPARDDRGTRPARSADKPASGGRFGDRERPAYGDKPARKAPPAAKPGRADEGTSRPAAHHRDHEDAPGTLRLSKLMSELGLCSRREADEWIENGWVLVDGVKIDTLGSKVRPDQRIEIDPAAQAIQARQVTILLHKPVGYVSGQAEDGYQPAITLVTPDNRWEGDHSDIRFSVSHLRQLAPAGRLDIDSTGLLVLTQDGRIAKRLIGGHSEVEKEYLVRVTYGEMTTEIDQHFPPESLTLLRHGLELDDVPLKPAKVSWQNGEQLRFVLREGKKRQIRRMCELVGLEVVGLKRVRMGSVPLGALPPGQWRYLSADESF